MKKAGSIISIIAGVFGVIAAVIEMSIGGIGHIAEVEGAGDVSVAASMGLIASFLIIIFGAIQNSNSEKWVSITLVGVSVFGMLFGGTFVAVSLLLSLIGGILGWLEHKNSKVVVSSENMEVKGETKEVAQAQTLTRKGLKLVLNAALVVFIIFFLALIWGGIQGATQGESDTAQTVSDNLDLPACGSEEAIGLVKAEMNGRLAENAMDMQMDALRRGSNAGVIGDEVIDIHNAKEIGTSSAEKKRYCSGTLESKLSGNVTMYYDLRRLNDGTIHVTISQYSPFDTWKREKENEARIGNSSQSAVKEDNSHYVVDGDDGSSDVYAGEDKNCNEAYPCRLQKIIDKNDWNAISSALSFGFQTQVTEEIQWKGKKFEHKGFVRFAERAPGKNCKRFDIVSYMGSETGSGEIVVCRDDDSVLSFH
ncbi:MAG: hypothetical protein A3J37_04075 [Alphaproteobacteria bacterium RIFCSPHIGHO2_12_FULL_45_9]|nr:MAG: hypothetical protein A3J37_04075 [Alphaproteobacteria bacterium RIFCSPHIGHO2_12_FULL_45_9]